MFVTPPIGPDDRAALVDAALAACLWINIAFRWRPNLPDEADNHLIELAIAGNTEWIMTNNTQDIVAGDLIFDGFRVVTPSEWLKET